jgi:voltage-gated potassium channel
MLTVLLLVMILGSLMYVIEGGANGFDSIPMSIYWAVITVTTVGYGDIVPITDLGKAVATLMMLIGYSIIAIPTGIVSVESGRASGYLPGPGASKAKTQCPRCKESAHLPQANYCHRCGFDFQQEA